LRHRWTIAFSLAAAIWFGMAGQALAKTPYDDLRTPEGWAWAQIKNGRQANFDARRGTTTTFVGMTSAVSFLLPF
jgi:hypothetical protein